MFNKKVNLNCSNSCIIKFIKFDTKYPKVVFDMLFVSQPSPDDYTGHGGLIENPTLRHVG